MIVVRLFALVGVLGLVLLGTGCASPYISTGSGTDGASEGSSDGSGTDGASAGSSDGSGGEAEAVCGNGVVEDGEDCDEGLETSTCNVNCTLAGCGDGIVNAAIGEQCDAGGESALCDDDCTPVSCGDGVVNEAAGEECEGKAVAGGTCEELGFDGGDLACDTGCGYDVSGCCVLPEAPVLALSFSQVKRFDFSWTPVAEAEHYQLLESPAPGEPYAQIGEDLVAESVSLEMPLHGRFEARYVLRACNGCGCTDSAAVDVVGSLEEAVGYFKASNTGVGDYFGWSVALSEDGNTLAVGAYGEESSATGIDGNQADNSAGVSGAVYVFVRDGAGGWSQQAYVKASNTGVGDDFGWSVALSADGDTLAVGARREDSVATGIGGNQADDSAIESGAVYVFERDGARAWSQQAYVKASNTGSGDQFGRSIALSGDGNILAVSAQFEDSSAMGIGGNQADDSAIDSGAVYVYARNGAGSWSQPVYVKASNTGPGDYFGNSLALSGDGNTLAVGARREDSDATGIEGNQANDSSTDSGAVYVFARNGAGAWSQEAYVKASNAEASDFFGYSVALSGDGNALAVGALEDSNATGIGGNQADNNAPGSGAVYVFERDGAGAWSQEAYVKASNTEASDEFGYRVALSGDGNTLAVGAPVEASNATGIGGNQADNSISYSGAVYTFVRGGVETWVQQAYVKAPNPGVFDSFGWSVALSGDGNILVVGAFQEYSNATGIGGNQADDSALNSGAVYLY